MTLDDHDWDASDGDDESAEMVPCPECQAEIFEDTPRCPYCGNYVVFRPKVWQSKPLWLRVLAWVLFVAAVLAFLISSIPFVF